VKEFIVKHTQLDTFEIEYVSEKELNSNQILEIEKAIRLYLEDYLNFIFTRKDKLQRSKSGKLKQFQSMLK
jgi:phenylacetate-CoA ligase